MGGGEKKRPLIMIMIAKSLDNFSNYHKIVANIVELIHTSTLLHDDVIDESEIRRKNKTIHKIFSNTISVLTGDFLYSRAFQILITLKNREIMYSLAKVTNKMTEGEILQESHRYNLYINEKEYMNII